MQSQELIVYLLMAGSFLAVAWMFVSRGGQDGKSQAREANWAKMPLAFRASWAFALLFEDSLGALAASLMPNRAKRMEEMAVVSALPLSARRVFAASFAFSLLGALVGAAAAAAMYVEKPESWSGMGALACILFAALGWLWPGVALVRYATARQQTLTRELPFAIDMIGSAMRSGLDFGAAMRYYVDLGGEGALRDEFARVLADVHAGSFFARALQDMAARVKVEAFTTFAGVVAYGMDIGAPIAQTLKLHGGDLRRERFNLAERRAARAPTVMIFPLALFIMPAVFIIVLTPIVIRLKDTLLAMF